jgi:hypothetical protein
MEQQFDEFKALKEMLESGAISKEEFDKMKSDLLRKSMANDGVRSAMEPSSSAKFFRKARWIIVILVLLAIGGGVAWFYLKPDPKKLAEKFSASFCECEIQRNKEYVNSLTGFLSGFDAAAYRVVGDVDAVMAPIDSAYARRNQSIGISSCFENLKAQESKLESKFKKGTSSGDEFWSDCDIMSAANMELTEQYQMIKQLKESVENKKAGLRYASSEELNARKQFVHDNLWNMYSSMSSGYFDAYNYFGYNVERYYGKKNITPTDINVMMKSETDHTDFAHKLISETVRLDGMDQGREIWLYSTEYKAWRPSMEKWQISNIWYRVVMNDQDKIESYTESRVENTKYFTAQEYNSMFGGSTYEENW